MFDSALCCPAFVMMMQATHFRNFDHRSLSRLLPSSWLWGVLPQREMGAPLMVQANNQKPILERWEKSITHGIPGMVASSGSMSHSSSGAGPSLVAA